MQFIGILETIFMKNKYLAGILYICVLMSATGCSIDADTNVNAQSEDHVETAAALSEQNQEGYTEGYDYYKKSAVSERENIPIQ